MAEIAVVMVPLPAQGHLNQLLNLSRLISSYKIPVHYVGTATHNRQARRRVQNWDPDSDSNLNFHDLSLPPPETPPPNPDSQLIPLLFGTWHLRHPLYDFVRQLSGTARRVVVVYDSLMAWVVQDVYDLLNTECYLFNSVSALFIYSLFLEAAGKSIPADGPQILKEIPSMDGCFPDEFLDYWHIQEKFFGNSCGCLHNCSRLIEGPFLDLLEKNETLLGSLKQWAIGPFNPVEMQTQVKTTPEKLVYNEFSTVVNVGGISDKYVLTTSEKLAYNEHEFSSSVVNMGRIFGKHVQTTSEKLVHDDHKFSSIVNVRRISGKHVQTTSEKLVHDEHGFSSVVNVGRISDKHVLTTPEHDEHEFLSVANVGRISGQRHECLDWLDNQARNSVIFVSFGTTTTLTGQLIKELASGLEKSRQKFVWVLRDADNPGGGRDDNNELLLPQGYEDRIRGRGIIVRDWAPQLKILAHPATGGFVSHCGWNSCMESMSMGVPIAAWPMHSDQPRNSVLITKFLGIGILVRDWERRQEVVTSTTIEQCILVLMASEEGEEMRRKAADLSVAIKKSVMDGGVSRQELDSFVVHITR